MDADQHTGENAETRQEQSSGWWTSPPIEPLNNYGAITSTKFFDQPPLIFAALMWAFPYSYLSICVFTVGGINLLFRTFGARASDFIPPASLAVFAGVAPLLFFVVLLVKGRWFLNNLFALLVFWLVLILTSGVTQGGITSALSRAYCAGN